uniref:Uncharacterized protein n=1 Tax=Strigamia maritima TaxID=126957 RepID=T1J8D8_STRMM
SSRTLSQAALLARGPRHRALTSDRPDRAPFFDRSQLHTACSHKIAVNLIYIRTVSFCGLLITERASHAVILASSSSVNQGSLKKIIGAVN